MRRVWQVHRGEQLVFVPDWVLVIGGMILIRYIGQLKQQISDQRYETMSAFIFTNIFSVTQV
jgi:hypothetical protein